MAGGAFGVNACMSSIIWLVTECLLRNLGVSIPNALACEFRCTVRKYKRKEADLGKKRLAAIRNQLIGSRTSQGVWGGFYQKPM